MNFSDFNYTEALQGIPYINPNSECWGEYLTFVFAFLFFASEVMPFIKARCAETTDVEAETKTEEPKKPNLLQESNGIIELATKLIKLKKQV